MQANNEHIEEKSRASLGRLNESEIACVKQTLQKH